MLHTYINSYSTQKYLHIVISARSALVANSVANSVAKHVAFKSVCVTRVQKHNSVSFTCNIMLVACNSSANVNSANVHSAIRKALAQQRTKYKATLRYTVVRNVMCVNSANSKLKKLATALSLISNLHLVALTSTKAVVLNKHNNKFAKQFWFKKFVTAC